MKWFYSIVVACSFVFTICLLQKTVFGQANTWPDFRGGMLGVPAGFTGALPDGLIYCEAPTDDSLPMICYFQGADSWAEATGANQTGGSIIECPGIGTRFVTIDNFVNCAGDTVTLTIDGAATVLTEGAQWAAGASNNDAATSLAVAITAVTGVDTSYVVGAGVIAYITPDVTTCVLILTEGDATCTTLTQGTNGTILIGDGTASNPALSFRTDPGTGIFSVPANAYSIGTGGTVRLTVADNTIDVLNEVSVDSNDALIFDSTGPQILGTGFVPGHGAATGDVGVGGQFIVDGTTWLEGNLTVDAAAYFDLEGYGAIGNGSTVSAQRTLAVDRDFTSSLGRQLEVGGVATVNTGIENIYTSFFNPQNTIITSGAHPIVATMGIKEPAIAEGGGTAGTGVSLYIKDGPTEGDSNYALWVDDDETHLDGLLTCESNVDIEGYVAIGDGSALNPNTTLTIDRDFTGTQGRQLFVTGATIINSGVANIYTVFVDPPSTTLTSGVHPIVTTMGLEEPRIIESGGTVGTGVTLHINDQPSEGDNNYGFWNAVDSRFDGSVEANSDFDVYDAVGGDGAYWREFHIDADSVDPGASGATASFGGLGNATFYWLLNATTEYLYFDTDIHTDWDAASNIVIEVKLALDAIEPINTNIEAEIIAEYAGEHEDMDVAKTQTRQVDHDITSDLAAGTIHYVTFILNSFLGGNAIDTNDYLKLRFRLYAQTDIAAVRFLQANVFYRSSKPRIETGGVFPSEG